MVFGMDGSPDTSRRWRLIPYGMAALLLHVTCLWGAVSVADDSTKPSTQAVRSETPGSLSPHGELQIECQLCHGTENWKPASYSEEFAHAKLGFTLDGAHATAKCTQCHATLEFAGLNRNCSTCHDDAHNGEFGLDCGRCHGTQTFVDHASQIAMHRTTRFPLVGVHAMIDCDQCHAAAFAEVTGTVSNEADCYVCHVEEYTAASSPNHVATGFSRNCSECHNSLAWDAGQNAGDHSFFPLRGGHANLDCGSCHLDASFSGLDRACVSCHAEDYSSTSSPQHQEAGFSTDCASCHTVTSWAGASFDHTGFPLTGAHGGVDCGTCHAGGVFTGLQTECYACHQSEYDASSNPHHASAGLSTLCQDCHGNTTWVGANYDHGFFALSGGHAGHDCLSCHAGESYSGTSPECYSCHDQDYAATVDPNHQTSGFSTDCTQCHGTTTWIGASFDHAAFPLTGTHGTLDCVSCHSGGVYTGLSGECYACHQDVYDATSNPRHASAAFATLCQACHGNVTWTGANYDHGFFALSGGHAGHDCLTCHVGETYAGTNAECLACHQQDYDSTSNPPHAAAGFGSDCTGCHNTTSWLGATFDHDTFFPIYSGAHRTPWNDCSDCHVNPASYAEFTCLSCHDHSQARMDDKHSGERGYSYDSNLCYECHPNGRH